MEDVDNLSNCSGPPAAITGFLTKEPYCLPTQPDTPRAESYFVEENIPVTPPNAAQTRSTFFCNKKLFHANILQTKYNSVEQFLVQNVFNFEFQLECKDGGLVMKV